MIHVVLHEPQELVNIAHVVRAMKNFGFASLRLVAPAEYDPYRIEGIAHRSGDLLAGVRQFATLPEALAGCVHVAAFSARGRTAKRNVQRPREAAAELVAEAQAGDVAVVFGREDRGLPNEALDLCHRVVTIPSRPDYPSLNLGHAVMLALYEVALAQGAEALPVKPPRRRAAPAGVEELERLVAEAARTIEAMGYFRNHNRELVMRSLRTIAQRTPLDLREAKLLRALAIEARKAVPPRAP